MFCRISDGVKALCKQMIDNPNDWVQGLTMTDRAMRDAFEKHFLKEGHDHKFINGKYDEKIIHALWMGWRECQTHTCNEVITNSSAIGGWLSAALSPDANVCDDFKKDINKWFEYIGSLSQTTKG